MERIAKLSFIVSSLIIIFGLGIISSKYDLLPSRGFDFIYHNSKQFIFAYLYATRTFFFLAINNKLLTKRVLL